MMEQKKLDKLLEKMEKGDAAACARLIDEGAIDPNERHAGKLTYLHWAAADGHAEVCRVLLAAKAKPNLKGGDQRASPLHAAAIYGHAEACEVLLKGRADPHSRDKSSYTPLHLAALNNNAEACRVLLEGGADIKAEPGDWTRAGENPMFACVCSWKLRKHDLKGVFDTLSVLLDHGGAPDETDSLRYTPLHRMAAAGNFDACRLLLAKGADIRAKANRGATPLHMAATEGKADICAYLIEEGASVRAKDSEGMTAMAIAKQKGFLDVEIALKSKSTRDKMEKEIAQGMPAGKGKTEKSGPGGL